MLMKTTEGNISAPGKVTGTYFGQTEGPLRSLPKGPPLSAPPSTSVRNAMLNMNHTGTDNIVVVDEPSNRPLGIITLSDLVHAIAFFGGDLEQPVAGLMTAAPFTLPADAPTHRATVLMTKRNVRHVILVEPDGLPRRSVRVAGERCRISGRTGHHGEGCDGPGQGGR